MNPAAHHDVVDFAAVQSASAAELGELAREAGLDVHGRERGEIAFALLRHRIGTDGRGFVDGTLEVLPDGFGFVRVTACSWAAQPSDPFVGPAQIRKLNLRTGQRIAGVVRPPRGDERFFSLQHVDRVDGADPAHEGVRVPFPSRTPILPRFPLPLAASDRDRLAAIGAAAPWARGQRVLVLTPPALAGRATLLAGMAAALRRDDAALVVLLCLVDQRPEDIAAVRAQLAGTGVTVVASTFDEPAARHVTLAEMALASAQRAVENGGDAVLLFDSLPALARACQVEQPPSGKLVCVGLDALATARGKRLFAAARACEEGGSLTVIATAVDGGSRVEDAVLVDFERAANSLVVYTTDLTPPDALPDLRRTATRSEDLLRTPTVMSRLQAVRAALTENPHAGPSALLDAALTRLAGTERV